MNLSYLIRLRVATIPLQIQPLCNPFHPEYVMAATCPLSESQPAQQRKHIIETYVGVRAAINNPLSQLCVSA